jgi:septal ring factor EnvC (AmiA/AmiB activator)
MPARRKRFANIETKITQEAAVSDENPVQAAFRRVSAILKQRAKLENRKAEAALLEAQLSKLNAENRDLDRELKDAEKAVRAEIPEAAAIFDAGFVKAELSMEKPAGRGRGRKSRGGKLSPDQVDKVLAGLTEPFGANDFSAKAEQLFPGVVNVPIKKLAAGKITQVPGTASRGTKYTRS